MEDTFLEAWDSLVQTWHTFLFCQTFILVGNPKSTGKTAAACAEFFKADKSLVGVSQIVNWLSVEEPKKPSWKKDLAMKALQGERGNGQNRKKQCWRG